MKILHQYKDWMIANLLCHSSTINFQPIRKQNFNQLITASRTFIQNNKDNAVLLSRFIYV